ncbi:MAG: hypothetical protein H7320_16370 [Ferruginibacter sp.]|nr:hypothetical protein [Ferruginibacter sp.]
MKRCFSKEIIALNSCKKIFFLHQFSLHYFLGSTAPGYQAPREKTATTVINTVSKSAGNSL